MFFVNYVYVLFRGCDNCEEWYHGDCIGVTQRDAKIIKVFFCQTCRGMYIMCIGVTQRDAKLIKVFFCQTCRGMYCIQL